MTLQKDDLILGSCWLYELDEERARELDKEHKDDMEYGPYFVNHEGEAYLIRCRDMDAEMGDTIEKYYCDDAEQGFILLIRNEEEHAMARRFLAHPDFKSCIVHYGEEHKLLILPDTYFLMQHIKAAL